MKPARSNADWLWGGAILVLTFLAYLPVWRGAFIWDDGVMVADNPLLRTGQGLHDIWWTTRAVDPLPVTMTALWLQWYCWDGNTLGYHLANVLMHGLGALLLWRLLLRLTKRGFLAWLAAMVFALHPVAVASAGWISEQKNTLSIVFYFLAILAYMRFAEGQNGKQYAWALICFVVALLSKGSVVMLPVMLLMIVWWRGGRIDFKDGLRLMPFFALSGLDGLFTIWIQNHKAIGGAMVQNVHGLARLADAARAVCFYAGKDLVPLNLSVIYPEWRSEAAGWMALAGLVLVFAVCWYFRKSGGRNVMLGLGCFVVTLFPVMGFFDMYFLVYSRVADHWQYLAMPALLSLAVVGGGYWFERASAQFHFPKMAGPLLASLLLMALFAGTWRRAGVYASEKSLWSDTVAKNPRAWMAWNNLGNACASEGEARAAIDAYEKALAVNTNFPDAESNLGNALVGQGQMAGAIVHLQKAVEEEPRMAKFHFNYGIGLAGLGRLDEAVVEYNQALALSPGMADVRNNLSHVLYQQKKFAAALQEAKLATQLNPNLAEPHLNAAKALSGLEQTNEAAQEFGIFLRLRPENAGAHFEYGMMLAMHGNLAAALPQFQEVVRLEPNESAGHGSLGNTLAGLHRIPEAAAAFRTALRLAPNDAQNHNNLANALIEQGQLGPALTEYSTAVNLPGADAGTRLNYALALERAGRRDEAVAQLREALRLRPGDSAIQQHLAALLGR